MQNLHKNERPRALYSDQKMASADDWSTFGIACLSRKEYQDRANRFLGFLDSVLPTALLIVVAEYGASLLVDFHYAGLLIITTQFELIPKTRIEQIWCDGPSLISFTIPVKTSIIFSKSYGHSIDLLMDDKWYIKGTSTPNAVSRDFNESDFKLPKNAYMIVDVNGSVKQSVKECIGNALIWHRHYQNHCVTEFRFRHDVL